MLWTSPLANSGVFRAGSLAAFVAISVAAFAERLIDPSAMVMVWFILTVIIVVLPALGATTGHARAQMLALAGAGLFLPAAAIAAQGLVSWNNRAVLAVMCTAGLGLVTIDVLFRNPFAELNCWPTCVTNPFLVWRSTDLVQLAQVTAAIVGTIYALAALGLALARSQRTSQRTAVLLFAAGVAAWTLGLILRTRLEPRNLVVQSRTLLTVVAIGAAAVAMQWPALRILWTRRRVRVLTADLIQLSAPGAVTRLLRSSVGDPTLEIVTSSRARTRSIDEGCTTTELHRDSKVVAAIIHRSNVADRVHAALTSAVVTVIENEQMLAEAHTQLDEVKTSRRQLVERSTTARRQLERDLHDGAQQRLLLLGLRFDGLSAVCDPADRPVIQDAIRQAGTALTELRRIAHGTTPPLLDDAGLGEALLSFAESADVRIDLDLDGIVDQRFTTEIEHGAYHFARTCIRHAEASRAASISIGASAVDRTLSLSATHLGDRKFDDMDDLDRIVANGGRVTSSVVDGLVTNEAKFG
jgi:signal transduction histidine kinase